MLSHCVYMCVCLYVVTGFVFNFFSYFLQFGRCCCHCTRKLKLLFHLESATKKIYGHPGTSHPLAIFHSPSLPFSLFAFLFVVLFLCHFYAHYFAFGVALDSASAGPCFQFTIPTTPIATITCLALYLLLLFFESLF